MERKRGFSDPEVAKKANKKSHETRKKSGRKHVGGFSNPEFAREQSIKGLEAARKNRNAKKASDQA